MYIYTDIIVMIALYIRHTQIITCPDTARCVRHVGLNTGRRSHDRQSNKNNIN